MGMFDYLKCDVSLLPGKIPVFVTSEQQFQTKSFDCLMNIYRISKNKKLFISRYTGDDMNPEKADKFTGEVVFYSSNIVARGAGVYTSKGEDAEWAQWKANFKNGKMISIVQTEYEINGALPSSAFHEHLKKERDPNKDAHISKLSKQSFLGKRIYIKYGGTTKGQYATIVAESKVKLCYKHKDTLELMFRQEYGRLFFSSKKEADKYDNDRKATWDSEKKQYDDFLKKWKKDRKKK